MTLHIEALLSESQTWFQMGVMNPGDQMGSLSQNLPDGRRELYLFRCESDEESKVYRSIGGVDASISDNQRLYAAQEYETIATLRDGQEYHLTIHPQDPNIGSLVRFTHRNP